MCSGILTLPLLTPSKIKIHKKYKFSVSQKKTEEKIALLENTAEELPFERSHDVKLTTA